MEKDKNPASLESLLSEPVSNWPEELREFVRRRQGTEAEEIPVSAEGRAAFLERLGSEVDKAKAKAARRRMLHGTLFGASLAGFAVSLFLSFSSSFGAWALLFLGFALCPAPAWGLHRRSKASAFGTVLHFAPALLLFLLHGLFAAFPTGELLAGLVPDERMLAAIVRAWEAFVGLLPWLLLAFAALHGVFYFFADARGRAKRQSEKAR